MTITKNPEYFYKFVSFDRIDILKNGLIRFTPIGNFNDPFELEPTISPLSSEFLYYVENLSARELTEIKFTEEDYNFSIERENMVDTYKKKYNEKIGKYGVLSLSSNDNINPLLSVSMPEKEDPRTNILMWSYYADSHKGFLIEFYNDFIDEIILEKVEYSEERHALTFEEIEEGNFDEIFLRKSIEWRHEQEYRAILPLEKCSEKHGDTVHLFKFNKSRIKSITFGCSMSQENKSIIKDIVSKCPESKHIIFYHSYLSNEGYFLEFYHDHGGWTNDPKFAPKSIPPQKKF